MRLLCSAMLLVIANAADSVAQELQNPHDALGFTRRGDLRWSSGDLEGAIRDYDEAIRLSPLSDTPRKRRGRALWAKGEVTAAIQELTEAIRLGGDDAQSFLFRGDAFSDSENPASALADYDEAIRLDPSRFAAFVNRACVRAELGDFRGAVADADEAIRIDPQDSIAWNNRGFARRCIGEKETALADFRHALELDPGSTLASLSVAWLLYLEHDYRQALAAIVEFLRAHPDVGDRDYLALLAILCCANLGESQVPDLALSVFERRDGLSPDDWGATLAAFLQGRIREVEVLKLPQDMPDRKARERECEAFFYAGAMRLANGDDERARVYLANCAATDMFAFNEFWAAKAELARIAEKK